MELTAMVCPCEECSLEERVAAAMKVAQERAEKLARLIEWQRYLFEGETGIVIRFPVERTHA